MIDIEKAFENRWRIKNPYQGGCLRKVTCEHISSCNYPMQEEYIKTLCRDFFEAGICLGEGEHCPPIPMSAIEKAAYDVIGFETFWNLYDKKVGRPKCEKLWEKLTLEERKICLDYIPLYKQAQPDKQYRKNPETFLRNKSWNDELIFRDNGKPTKPNAAERLTEILIG